MRYYLVTLNYDYFMPIAWGRRGSFKDEHNARESAVANILTR